MNDLDFQDFCLKQGLGLFRRHRFRAFGNVSETGGNFSNAKARAGGRSFGNLCTVDGGVGRLRCGQIFVRREAGNNLVYGISSCGEIFCVSRCVWFCALNRQHGRCDPKNTDLHIHTLSSCLNVAFVSNVPLATIAVFHLTVLRPTPHAPTRHAAFLAHGKRVFASLAADQTAPNRRKSAPNGTATDLPALEINFTPPGVGSMRLVSLKPRGTMATAMM